MSIAECRVQQSKWDPKLSNVIPLKVHGILRASIIRGNLFYFADQSVNLFTVQYNKMLRQNQVYQQ